MKTFGKTLNHLTSLEKIRNTLTNRTISVNGVGGMTLLTRPWNMRWRYHGATRGLLNEDGRRQMEQYYTGKVKDCRDSAPEQYGSDLNGVLHQNRWDITI